MKSTSRGHPTLVKGLFEQAFDHHQSGRLTEAEKIYHEILHIDNRHADSHHLLGVIGYETGRHSFAIESINKAINLKAGEPVFRFNLGLALHALGNLDQAVVCYEQALTLKPEYPKATLSLGNALMDQGKVDEAAARYRQAIILKPDNTNALWAVVMSGIPAVCSADEDPVVSRERFSRGLDELHAWFGSREVADGWEAVGSLQPFYLAYQEEDNQSLLSRYGALCNQIMSPWQQRQGYRPGELSGAGPIRVGIVSDHLFNHSVWHALIQGWMLHLDRNKVELHVFYLGTKHDSETARAQTLATSFTEGKWSLSQWAEAILAQRIEVLIFPEIGMRAMTAKLANLRLAPVQMATWGHPETSGLPTIDYYLSAEDLESDTAEHYYTEKLVKLPHLGCCYPANAVTPVAPDLAQLGIDPNRPLLLCPGAPFKYAPQFDWVLVDIARKLGRCQLIFFTHFSLQSQSEKLRERLDHVFRQAGLNFQDFGVFVPWLDRPAFYGLMLRADVYLDTLGFSGFNTAIQAVECALPIVTREGRFMRGRLASGILKRMTLPELVAASDEDYVALAVKLAHDTEYRRTLKARIAASRHLLFDDLAPIRALENVLVGLCRPLAGKDIATDQTNRLMSHDLEPAEINQLLAIFNDGRQTELESRALLLLEQYPHSGLVWKALGACLQVQGKEALSALRKTTELLPDDPEAHSNLGNAMRGIGQLDDSVASYRRALTIKPDFAEAYNNLGNVLQNLGQLDDSATSFHRSLQIKPDFAEAHNNLGIALRSLGQLDKSLAGYRRALAIKPGYAEALFNLGNAQQDIGQLDDSLTSYRRALAIEPDYAEAYNNAGLAQQGTGQTENAIADLRRALEIKPDFAEAHNNLGTVLQDIGQLDNSLTSFYRALQTNPDFVEAHNNLGHALQGFGQLENAVASYRRALEVKPDFAEAHSNLGTVRQDIGQLDNSLASFHRALQINPNFVAAHNDLGHALQGFGRLEDAVASYRRALEIKPDLAEVRSNLLFIHNYLSDQPAGMMLSEAMRFGELTARQARPAKSWANVPDPDRYLRVGLVSGDLCNHPVGCFVEGILAELASNAHCRLGLIAYLSHFRTDALTERIKTSCFGWHSAVGLSDEALARRIRDDGVDILLDLSGHTAHNRLPMFAWKPAPVQVSWLGYFATTGVPGMDYLIADPWSLPESEEAYFTEKIWRLPETRLCFTAPDVNVDVSALPALSKGYITFGCFNNLTKINGDVIALWARVLVAVPSSRLFLKTKQLMDASVKQDIIERFASRGIGVDRLILEGFDPRAAYLAAYNQVDIALDPFPFPGGATTAESLWMGVPVLTLSGERFLSRQGIGLLMNAGLPEWIAKDVDDYVARAVGHAGDLQYLAKLREGLRQRVLASPLFDAPRFAQYFEEALRGMWAKWCRQYQPQSS